MAAGDLTFIDQDDQGGSYRAVFATDDFVYVANYNGNLGIMTYSVDPSGGLTFIDNDDSVDQSTEGVWHDGTWAYAAYSTAGPSSLCSCPFIHQNLDPSVCSTAGPSSLWHFPFRNQSVPSL